MTASKLIVALTLLLSATSASLAQPVHHYRYTGAYGHGAPDNGSPDYQPDMGADSGH
jgi:hypothetical protein